MKNLASDILKRIKRLWILLIVLPLLTGTISYYMEAREPTSYTGEAILSLGNFENAGLTNPSWVAKHLGYDNFLRKVLSASNSNLETDTVKEKLKAEVDGDNEVNLSVTGANKEEVKNIMSSVVDGFMSESNKLWEINYNMVNGSIKETEAVDSEVDGADKQKLLYDLRETKKNLERGKNIISEPISISQNYNNPLKRAIFGVLIGIMLNILILFLPELFRSDSKR